MPRSRAQSSPRGCERRARSAQLRNALGTRCPAARPDSPVRRARRRGQTAWRRALMRARWLTRLNYHAFSRRTRRLPRTAHDKRGSGPRWRAGERFRIERACQATKSSTRRQGRLIRLECFPLGSGDRRRFPRSKCPIGSVDDRAVCRFRMARMRLSERGSSLLGAIGCSITVYASVIRHTVARVARKVWRSFVRCFRQQRNVAYSPKV